MNSNKMQEEFEKNLRNGSFIYRCSTHNTGYCGDQKKVFQEVWDKAKNFEDFLDLLRHVNAEFAARSQAWGEIAKQLGWAIPIVEEMRRIEVEADAGSVKIGSLDGSFSICIPNGYGDGGHEVIFVKRESFYERKFNHEMTYFLGSIEGKFQIYPYDCNQNEPAIDIKYTFEGRYSIYAYNGTAILEEWEN